MAAAGRLGIWALAVALALSACGGNGGEGQAPPGQPVARIDVRETEFKLDPPNPSIGKPGLVEIRAMNRGTTPHAIDIEGPAGEIASEEIPPGEEAVVRADLSKEGSFEWYCPVDDHRGKGMEGTITVGAAGAGAQPPADEGEGESSGGSSGY